jgi:hypothetical protein
MIDSRIKTPQQIEDYARVSKCESAALCLYPRFRIDRHRSSGNVLFG